MIYDERVAAQLTEVRRAERVREMLILCVVCREGGRRDGMEGGERV